MDREYYKEYYHLEREHWWFKARLNILESWVKQLANGRKLRILNVGAATGATSEMLDRYGEVTTVEYDGETCDFLRKELNIPAIQASCTDLPLKDDSFDLVCAFDVLEHIEDDDTAAKELRRVTVPGGFVFCTVPSFMFLWSGHDVVNHHHRRYTRSSFKRLFEATGKTLFSSYFNFFLFFPVALVRLISGRSSGSSSGRSKDFSFGNGGAVGKLLYRIFLVEKFFLLRRISFPVGVSFLLIWKKQ